MSREKPTIAEYDDAIARLKAVREAINDLPGEPLKNALFNAGVPIENVISISYDLGQMYYGQLWNAEMFLESMRKFQLEREGNDNGSEN